MVGLTLERPQSRERLDATTQLKQLHRLADIGEPMLAEVDQIVTLGKASCGIGHDHLATMRSGSSLCAHMMMQAGVGHYIGETHMHYENADSPARIRAEIRSQSDREGVAISSETCIDKVCHNYFPNGLPELLHTPSLWILLRDPLTTWLSLLATSSTKYATSTNRLHA